MRSRSCNFQKKSGSPARRVAPGPSLNRLKSKKSTCVPLKTLNLNVLISIAKLHLLPTAGVTDSLRSPKEHHPLAGSHRSHTDPLNETSWLRPWCCCICALGAGPEVNLFFPHYYRGVRRVFERGRRGVGARRRLRGCRERSDLRQWAGGRSPRKKF